MGKHQQGQIGKLTWAARQWATGRAAQTADTDDEVVREARQLGLSEADIAALQEALAAPAIGIDNFDGVWPENVEIVRAFLSVATQWRLVSIGGGLAPSRLFALGFDYAGVRAGLDAEGIAVTPELWVGLRVMEGAAREAMNGMQG